MDISSVNMRRLAQFVRLRLRLRASRVSRLASCLASVCICVSRLASCLASVCISRLVCVSRLRASGSVCASASASACVCVCVRLASRVCVRLASASACVSRLRASASACVSRLASRVCVHLRLASACVSRLASRVCVHLSASRVSRLVSRLVCVSRLVSRLCASVCVSRLSRVCLSPCECLRGLAHFMRRSSFKEFKRSSYYLSRLYQQTFNILI